jgi:hypothetical protein
LGVNIKDIAPGGIYNESEEASPNAIEFTLKEDLVSKAMTQLNAPAYYLVDTGDNFPQSKSCTINSNDSANITRYVLTSTPSVIAKCESVQRR